MNGEGITVLKIVHIYASLERLVQSLVRENLRKSELVSHFIRGFNSISGTMDFVDIGDESGLMSEKLNGSFPKSHLANLKDQIQGFLKLSACRFMVLGLGSSEAYDDCFKSITNRDPLPCKICLLRLSLAEEDEVDQRWIDLQFRFSQASVKGLFVPKTPAATHKLSFVDIVKHTSPRANTLKEEDSMTLAPRKVSNASTVSTQADDEYSNEMKVPEPEFFRSVSKQFYPDDIMSVKSDFSELACSTKQRKIRMENRKKEIQAKKLDIGLLAVVHCPRDEPDRSNISPISTYLTV